MKIRTIIFAALLLALCSATTFATLETSSAQPRGLDKIRKKHAKKSSKSEAEDLGKAEREEIDALTNDELMEKELDDHVVVHSDISYAASLPSDHGEGAAQDSSEEGDGTADADGSGDKAKPDSATDTEEKGDAKQDQTGTEQDESEDSTEEPARDHLLDLYLPEDKENFPVMFFVHGGTWVWGEKRHGKAIANGLVDDGYGVVSVNYTLCYHDLRTGEKAQYPTFAEDVAAAFKWTWDNIGEYGGNRERIFIGGHSAGGHIAALLATNPKFMKAHDLDNQQVIKGVVGISGVYEIPFNNPLAEPFFRIPFPNDASVREEASPIKQASEGDAPTLLLYGPPPPAELPMIIDWAAAYYERLQELEIDVSVKMIPKRDHESILRYFGTPGDLAEKTVREFLEKRLKELDESEQDASAESDGEASDDGVEGDAAEESKGEESSAQK